MTADSTPWNRLALIAELSERMEPKHGDFGHTALMKFMYLLQTLKGVPLEYNFTLYSYGPYDSSVLDDLSYATSLDAVTDKVIHYPGGSYGYNIAPAQCAAQVKNKADAFLKDNKDKIDWVVEQFEGSSASDLELISTIIYADQELQQKKEKLLLNAFVTRVHNIKPHFTEAQVEKRTREAYASSMVCAVDLA